jgi:hypothetical protein
MRLDKRISFFIEKWVRMDGNNLDFNAYDAFRLPYEADERKMLLTAGRQVGKTAGRFQSSSRCCCGGLT